MTLREADETTQSHIDLSDDLENPLIRRLGLFAPFSSADRKVLVEAMATTLFIPAQTDMVREGDPPKHVHVVLEGFACRYKIVEGGRRQIVTFLVPGDICDAHIFVLDRTDHSIATLSDTKVAVISRDVVDNVFAHRPAIMKALLWSSLVGESVAREWLANMGRRSPDKRIGHLLCEMLTRLRIAGLASHNRFAFPVTQTDIGDTVGLSTVHVNRTLQELKEKKLIASRRWLFEVLDLERLEDFSDFDPSYLHCPNVLA